MVAVAVERCGPRLRLRRPPSPSTSSSPVSLSDSLAAGNTCSTESFSSSPLTILRASAVVVAPSCDRSAMLWLFKKVSGDAEVAELDFGRLFVFVNNRVARMRKVWSITQHADRAIG